MTNEEKAIKEAEEILIERHLTEYEKIYQKKLREIKKEYAKEYRGK